MQTPILQADDSLAILAVVSVMVAAAMWMDRLPVGKWLPAPIAALLAGLLLGTSGVVPHDGPVTDLAHALLVPVAIPLLLFKADIRIVLRGIGSMLGPFVLASVATVIATVVVFLLVPLGPEGPAFAATNAAGFLGGTVNFVTVGRAEGLSAESFALAGALFIVLQLPYIAFQQWIILQRGALRLYGENKIGQMAAQENHDAAPHSEGSIAGLVAAVALALVIAATGKAIATALGHPQYALLVVTVLALAVANLASRRMQAIKGEAELGGVLLLAYFVLIAMAADARVLVTQVGPATWFVSAVLIMHLIILLGVGWILRMPLPQLMLASNATIGGPASAAALSKSSNNVSLLTPSVLAGMLGYATSTFVALALADILRSLA